MVDNRTSCSVGQRSFCFGLSLPRSPASPCDMALVILMVCQRHNADVKGLEIMSIENIVLVITGLAHG